MPNNGYFDVPFAIDGDLVTIPDAAQPDGSVSYTQGFPVSYSTPVASGGKNVPRTAINQALLDITTALQQLQQNGAPPFITTAMNNGTPYSYTEGATVAYSGNVYISLINANTTTPTVGAGNAAWRLLLTIPAIGQCIFQYTSATVVTLLPKKGNQITFPSGAVGILPSGGYPSTSTSLYLNGTAAQPLAASTLYYAYAWFNAAGALVVDFSTVAYATDANTGIVVKNGDSTRVLVGMVYTDASAHFVSSASDIQVRSWFNETGILTSGNLNGNYTTNSSSPGELGPSIRNTILTWAGERVTIALSGDASNTTNGDGVGAGIGIDSTTTISGGASGGNSLGANGGVNIATTFFTNSLTEGLHFATLLGYINGGGVAQFTAANFLQCITSR